MAGPLFHANVTLHHQNREHLAQNRIVVLYLDEISRCLSICTTAVPGRLPARFYAFRSWTNDTAALAPMTCFLFLLVLDCISPFDSC